MPIKRPDAFKKVKKGKPRKSSITTKKTQEYEPKGYRIKRKQKAKKFLEKAKKHNAKERNKKKPKI